jgi:hypothetical protein
MQQKRSIFGPLLLIATGVIWLLVKAGTIPVGNLWALTHVWPFLLIAAGVGILLRPYSSYTTILIDLLIIGGLVYAIVNAPKYKWDNPSLAFVGDGEIFMGPGEPGSGKVITKTYSDFDGFHAVEINYPAEVNIEQGKVESVTIEAEDNLLPYLNVEVQGGTLNIYYKKTGEKHINPTEPVIITITVKDLDEIDFSSAGKLTAKNLKADDLDVSLNGAGEMKLLDLDVKNLKVRLSGAGDLTVSGTADMLDVHISGVGSFNGEDLEAQTADVSLSGAGSATVWVAENLDASVSGVGSVSYYGDPSVSKNVSGVGSVKSLGDK